MITREMKENLQVAVDPIDEYKREMLRMLQLYYPTLKESEIESALDYAIEKRFKDAGCSLYNNYKEQTMDTTLYKLTKYIESKKPIVTAFGVLFMRHGTIDNPLYEFIEELANVRVMYKDKMFECMEKGDTEGEKKYNLLQLLAKVDMNSLYGCFGAPSAVFFNLHVAPTITTQGRSLISAAITFFEEFLEDNVWFGSMEEVQTFIFNVLEEKPYRKYKDEDIIPGFKATVPMVLYKLLKNSGYLWVPTKDEGLVLWDQLSRLGQEDLNRIYLKNNLFEFCKSPVVIGKIVQSLTKLQHPFLNPNKPPKEIKEDLEEIMDYFKEYVYYEYPVLDKMERVDKMPRDSVLIVDTDSCIISLEHWFQFVSKYTNGIDMRIKHMQLSVIDEIDRDEFGDLPKFKVFEKVEKCYDYDMMTDELIERKRKISPLKIIPEDGLRSSIINIMSYILSQLILDYFEGISVRDHSWTPGWDCLLIMKNEFLMKAILLGFVKKHYCSNVLVKEGHLVRNPKKKLAITGFEFDKVNIPKSTSKALKEIMFEQILDRDEGIDQLQILNSLATLEKKIHESLLNGETKYYKPAKVKAMNAYEDPMRIQGIKGAFAYNQLKTSKERVIDLESPNSLIIIKTKIDKKTAEKVHQSNPDLYEKIMGVLEKSEYKNGISSIAIHYDDPIPEWIKPFINVQEILQDNLKSFPLESIGINKISNQYVTTSNIISI